MALRFGCGPAAGRYVLLKLLDLSVTQADLSKLMRTARDGHATYPTNFARAMRQFDLRATVKHPMSIEQFRKHVDSSDRMVVAAFFNHWYPVKRIEDDLVTFYCSIQGELVMDIREFEACWVDKSATNKPYVNLGIVIRRNK